MDKTAAIEKRRQTVGELWLRGVPVLRIATQLGVPHRTIRSDIAIVRKHLQEERTDALEGKRDRSVAVLRKVQQEAWALYHRIEDTSTSKIGALNSIVAAEEKIARLEGTLGPPISQSNTTVNVLAADAEWQAVRSALLSALMPHVEARVAVAATLRQLEERRDLKGV